MPRHMATADCLPKQEPKKHRNKNHKVDKVGISNNPHTQKNNKVVFESFVVPDGQRALIRRVALGVSLGMPKPFDFYRSKKSAKELKAPGGQGYARINSTVSSRINPHASWFRQTRPHCDDCRRADW